MQVLSYTLARLEKTLGVVENVAASDFPQKESRDGIGQLRDQVRQRISILRALPDGTDNNLVIAACQESLAKLFRYLPLLGIFLRSTNVRNAFELHRPLSRLAKLLVGSDVKLILSSEWDYSPFTWHQITDLADYILIGLPASESSNALAVPLAGHELGHAVWTRYGLDAQFGPPIEATILQGIDSNWAAYKAAFPHIEKPMLQEVQGRRTWLPAYQWGLSQAKETFCDFVGVRTFGKAFLEAFAYLLAPGTPTRTLSYPTNEKRSAHLVKAATAFGVAVDGAYQENFKDGINVLAGAQPILVDLSDAALTAIVDSLLESCKGIVKDVIPVPDTTAIKEILEGFALLIPASGQRTLTDILNAGWQAANDSDFWNDQPRLIERKVEILNELVLKSVEVIEIESLIHQS